MVVRVDQEEYAIGKEETNDGDAEDGRAPNSIRVLTVVSIVDSIAWVGPTEPHQAVVRHPRRPIVAVMADVR